MADLTSVLIAEAGRIEEDALYSAKGHFEASRQWGGANLAIGIPTIVAGALAAATAVKSFVLVAGALSAGAAIGSALLTFLKPSDRATQHMQAGNAYKSLHNRSRMLREIECVKRSSDPSLVDELKNLSEERDLLNQKSPGISRSAFRRARRGIEEGEATYRVDRGS
jgi:hypothetical protein